MSEIRMKSFGILVIRTKIAPELVWSVRIVQISAFHCSMDLGHSLYIYTKMKGKCECMKRDLIIFFEIYAF